MELTNAFAVTVPVEEAWLVFTDLETIVPCLPGARLEEAEGDEFRGAIKVKVGSVTASYRGRVRFVEQDRESGRLVLAAEGKDVRGQGTARATITAELASTGDGGTTVTMTTDMAVTGIVAQFGRGIMADVSKKLIDRFAVTLEARLQERSATPDEGVAPDGAVAPPLAGEDATARAPGGEAPSPGVIAGAPGQPRVRRIDSAPVEPLELTNVAAAAVARRAARVGAGVAVVAVVVWLIVRLA